MTETRNGIMTFVRRPSRTRTFTVKDKDFTVKDEDQDQDYKSVLKVSK